MLELIKDFKVVTMRILSLQNSRGFRDIEAVLISEDDMFIRYKELDEDEEALIAKNRILHVYPKDKEA